MKEHVMYPVPEPEDPQTKVAGAYEGKEVVLFLGTPITSKVETWAINFGTLAFWFLQKHDDEVRAVSAYYNEADVSDRSKLDIPLTDLVAEIKKADAERDRITGGRLIVTPASAASDSNIPQPMIVTDANKLKDLYQASGAVYEGDNNTVLPPPPPDGYTPPTTKVTTTSIIPTSSTTTSTTNAVTTTTTQSTTTSTSSVSSTTTAATGLTLSVSDATATEGEVMVFVVSLNTEPLSTSVVVNYEARNVTAEFGSDYTAPSGTFVFNSFDIYKTIKVYTKDDSETEETETFEIIISQPMDATIENSIGTGTITDND